MPPERKKLGRLRKDVAIYGAKDARSGVSRRSYTREEKAEVINWIRDEENWVWDPYGDRIARVWSGLQWDGDIRPPTAQEVM
ncbi:hypothetical protein BU23DRAFT_561139, partial [Bimuria novae-zelandiae CBS 107.79]